MSAGTVSAEVGFGTLDYEGEPVIRFLRGMHLMGQTPYIEGKTLVEHAIEVGVDIRTEWRAGSCG